MGYVGSVVEMIFVSNLIRASAQAAFWELALDDIDWCESIDCIKRHLRELDLLENFASRLEEPQRFSEIPAGSPTCALSLQPIHQSDATVALGRARCIAPCGNMFVNRVLRTTGRSLFPAPHKESPDLAFATGSFVAFSI